MANWRTVTQVDAFTLVPFTGNAAAVVPDADDLDPVVMQRIAREINVSETAFVLKSAVGDFRIRWFTPVTEVPLCGHATVATCHALAEAGRLAVPGSYRIETASGLLTVDLATSDHAPCYVWLDMPIPIFAPANPLPVALSTALGIDVAALAPDPPIRGGEYLYVAVNSLAPLLTAKPDFSALRLLSHTHDVTGFMIYTMGGLENSSAIHSRFFAPALGIDEDPATGSAQGPLGALLVGLGRIPHAGQGAATVGYQAEQGDAMGRAGRIQVEVHIDERGEPTRARVGGTAVTVLRGELHV